MATHSSILTWRIPWMEEPSGLESIWTEEAGGLESIGSQRVGHN